MLTDIKEHKIGTERGAGDVEFGAPDVLLDIVPLGDLDVVPVDDGVQLLAEGCDDAQRGEGAHQRDIWRLVSGRGMPGRGEKEPRNLQLPRSL